MQFESSAGKIMSRLANFDRESEPTVQTTDGIVREPAVLGPQLVATSFAPNAFEQLTNARKAWLAER